MEKYIKTKQAQVIDAEERYSDIVYLLPTNFCHSKVLFNGNEIKVVTFDIEHYVMVESKLYLAKMKKAIFKQDTFYSIFPNGITPQNYANAFIIQMEHVNSIEEFSGNEIQQTRFWHLTSNDVEIVEI